MPDFTTIIILNHSIIIAAVIGIFRFKAVIRDYYPFLFIVWLALTNESLSLVMIYTIGNNTVNSNIYVLLEYGLILFQFYKWNGSNYRKYYLLAFLGLGIWMADNFILHSISRNNSLFRVFYSFIIVFLSIDKVNNILVFKTGPLLKDPTVIICAAFLFYYGCKAFVEAFNMFHLGLSDGLLKNLWIILYIVNFITNLLFALAILWIPTKQKFTFRY